MVPRELIIVHLRRPPDPAALFGAIARTFGIAVAEVDALAGLADPVVRVGVFAEEGDFAAVVEMFVDRERAASLPDAEVAGGLARALGDEVLYDDGASGNPYRWVLVRADGARFEVFSDPRREMPGLALDAARSPRPLVDPELAGRAAYYSSRDHLPLSERATDELRWCAQSLDASLAAAAGQGVELPADAFARLEAIRAELVRRQA